MDAITQVPRPRNEPVRLYRRGSDERASLEAEVARMSANPVDLPHIINGQHVEGAGDRTPVVQPHAHGEQLGTLRQATAVEAEAAVAATRSATGTWRELSFDDRAAIFLKAAELAAGPWRDRLNAATILGQSKSFHQAEIDSACELIDFWRFNVHFARQLQEDQPVSSPGLWNRAELRPLEGFVYAVTPFNFTAIAGNLPTAPALMGNTVIWKPASTQQRAASVVMELLIEAGLPPGVINMVTGSGATTSEHLIRQSDLAGLHFTGSTRVFQQLWRQIGENISGYDAYPRIVGETGGKDFIVAHPSADRSALATALLRGAFEYQGQKCSAASRAYIPASIWNQLETEFAEMVRAIPVGDPREAGTFMGAVIDDRSFSRLTDVLDRSAADPAVRTVVGGGYDRTTGYFVDPTVLVVDDPGHLNLREEFFGPILTVFIYPDADHDRILDQVDEVSSYALTGAYFAQDRTAIAAATTRLRFSAGNFYINDKPTGAVVGQQPFGGARASGTNDKAGSPINLLRWASMRAIKENLAPDQTWQYPHMDT